MKTSHVSASNRVIVRRGSDVVAAIERFSPEDSVDAIASMARGEPVDPSFLMPVPRKAAETPQLSLVSTYLDERLRRRSGFVSAALLNGQQGEVAVYSQWRLDGDAPTTFPAEWSVREALASSNLKRVDARTFVVDFTAPFADVEITEATSPHAHFGVFTMAPSSQQRLLELAREHAPNSIGAPGLNAISFHRSLDGGEVINLGVWTGFEGLTELLSRPGFQGGNEYWLGVANFHNVWFDVARVVAGQ